jgi:hypothetical protein
MGRDDKRQRYRLARALQLLGKYNQLCSDGISVPRWVEHSIKKGVEPNDGACCRLHSIRRHSTAGPGIDAAASRRENFNVSQVEIRGLDK